MLTIIIGALVNILIFFFEQWWTNHHPVNPAPTKAAYLAEVGKWKYFWMGPNRVKYASQLHDKAVARFVANPPVVELSSAPLTQDSAHKLANAYCGGLTL